MNKLTLKQLRYFEAIARHRHFGYAAEACAVSQPAISVQVKELEETIGQILFERSARKVRLTSFGEEFAVRVRDILRSVDELGDFARTAQGQLLGKLRLGVIPTIAPYLLPTLIGHLTKTYDGIDINVRETLTSKLMQELSEGRLDAAIVALPVSEPTFNEVALFTENLVLVRPQSDADKPVPSKESLLEMKLLLLEEGHCFRDQALSYCSARTGTPSNGLDGSSLATLVQMVGVGAGVTLIPDMAIRVETRSAAVSVARFEDPQPSRTVGMIWRKASPLAEQLQTIADVVRRSAEASPAA